MIVPYRDEAVSSWVRRMELRGRMQVSLDPISPEEDLKPSRRLIAAARSVEEGAGRVLATCGLNLEWPAAYIDDLMDLSDGRCGKACRACLEEDAAAGRDQYFRREWLFIWRVTCRHHGLMLQDITACVLAPVFVDSNKTSRIKLLRDVDLQNDPFLRPSRSSTWRSRKGPPLHAIAFENACMEALGGAPFENLWCCGSTWSEVQPVLLELADLLVAPGKDGPQRAISNLPDEIKIPFVQTNRFASKAMTRLSAVWQAACMHALATTLVDPSRFELVLEHQFYDAFLFGRNGKRLQADALGQLALKDPLAIIFASVADSDLQRFMINAEHWPGPFLQRARTAESIALCLQSR
jgi:hypothetical protein